VAANEWWQQQRLSSKRGLGFWRLAAEGKRTNEEEKKGKKSSYNGKNMAQTAH
jgi:hypothetical protein